MSATEPGRVHTRIATGVLAGQRLGEVTAFRGVPYAEPPVGALRFASPRPPRPFTGVRDAIRPAPAACQPADPGGSEDCLYANVWTPAVEGRRPVLVYIHGGGWQKGSGGDPTYDGSRLAARGDLVVVTFNYRLGPFGFGLHEAFWDERTGSCANWGLQDQIALLHWVRENAAAFGGDPDNITVCGTSAGGASAWQLSLLPGLRDTIRRIIPISACHVTAPTTSQSPEDARRVYGILARRLGTTVPGLRAVPAAALRDAGAGFFAGRPADRPVRTGRWYRGPVLDGRWMRGFDHELPTPQVPVLSVHTRTEGSFYTGPGSPQPAPAPDDEASLRHAVREVLLYTAGEETVGGPDGLARACVEAYREAAHADRRAHDPLSVWTEVWGDVLFRHGIVRLAERHARLGRTPLYAMEFSHPVRPPYFGTPHTSDAKFLFGTHGLPQHVAKFGDGPVERRVAEAFMDVVARFAWTSRPEAPGLPAWPAFAPDRPSTLVLGGARIAETAMTGKYGQLAFWDGVPWMPRP
ncbi:carboxylesterase/lipase family protein [Streptomyces sp. NPDC052023]|uniref:carboxylesterase/lipase family protein n=1 Tax=Streptomyces sp. NPDC052023 TaxID=3365681 RepID=UPI0037D185D5